MLSLEVCGPIGHIVLLPINFYNKKLQRKFLSKIKQAPFTKNNHLKKTRTKSCQAKEKKYIKHWKENIEPFILNHSKRDREDEGEKGSFGML